MRPGAGKGHVEMISPGRGLEPALAAGAGRSVRRDPVAKLRVFSNEPALTCLGVVPLLAPLSVLQLSHSLAPLASGPVCLHSDVSSSLPDMLQIDWIPRRAGQVEDSNLVNFRPKIGTKGYRRRQSRNSVRRESEPPVLDEVPQEVDMRPDPKPPVDAMSSLDAPPAGPMAKGHSANIRTSPRSWQGCCRRAPMGWQFKSRTWPVGNVTVPSLAHSSVAPVQFPETARHGFPLRASRMTLHACADRRNKAWDERA